VKFGDRRLIETVRSIRWADLSHVTAVLTPLLEELANSPEWIADAMDNLLTDDHLRSLTERLAELDKLVLLDDPESGARVRVHVFRQGYFDRPHNHRFTFGTRILSGSYVHTVYGDFDDRPSLDPAELTPKLIKRELAGTGYVIQHTLVHSVAADADTITLTVRGPAQKDQMLIIDPKTGRSWPVFGMKDESEEEIMARRLDTPRLESIIELMGKQGII